MLRTTRDENVKTCDGSLNASASQATAAAVVVVVAATVMEKSRCRLNVAIKVTRQHGILSLRSQELQDLLRLRHRNHITMSSSNNAGLAGCVVPARLQQKQSWSDNL